MRGFPPVQLFILGLVFGLLAFPLARLTTGYAPPAQDRPPNAAADAQAEVPTLVRLRFAHRPLTVSLKQGDKEMAQTLDLSASPVEFKTGLKTIAGVHEFILSATWPEGTPDTALTVELEPDGFEINSETKWSSEAALNEVLTFTW